MQDRLRIRSPWHLWDEVKLRQNVGVYVHVPFCLHRCRYCDFLSFAQHRPPGLTPDTFADTLAAEIAGRGAWARTDFGAQGRRVDSVFFGGGTPTYLPAEALAGLVAATLAQFPMARSGVEVTVEANPDTLRPGYLEALARAGVNRLSVGVQATQERHLRFLGRTHRWHDILPALHQAARGPIPRLSFDLIYAVPGLSLRELRESIERLLELHPEHISAYELTVEPGTWLGRWAARHPRQLPGPSAVVEQQQQIERRLARAGLYRYEVSNYARPGAESRHNLRYWRGGDYIGLGLGAASRTGTAVVNNSGAWEEYRRGAAYAGGPEDPLVQAAEVAARALAGGVAPPADAFLRLRTRLGVPLSGIPAAARPQVAQWLARGWIRLERGRMELTTRGLNFADGMAREL